MHLCVEVIEAKELVSKDANGKSDPFCALYLESAPTRRYNTAVKTSTLSPVWEEHFELWVETQVKKMIENFESIFLSMDKNNLDYFPSPLEDPENDVLFLEVW